MFCFIENKKNKDGTVKLPNGEICNIPELYDYMSISYLATHELLTVNNIIYHTSARLYDYKLDIDIDESKYNPNDIINAFDTHIYDY